MTVDRLKKIKKITDIYIITRKDLHPQIIKEIDGVDPENIIVEPLGKNTAPAIGMMAALFGLNNPDEIMGVFPADHLIVGHRNFEKAINTADFIARKDENLVTIGIKPTFASTAYFFARKLHKELGVPVGIIDSSWGGTSAEAWTPVAGLEKLGYHESLKQALESPQKPDQKIPTRLYNGMIQPLRHLTIKGVIWYQGESNVTRAAQYELLFSAMIRDWRTRWGGDEFPFYFVQIAPYDYGMPMECAELREAQIYYRRLTAWTLFFSTLKVMKFMNLSERLSFLWRVLGHAKVELLAFLGIFMVLLLSFGLLATTLMGYHVRELHNVPSEMTGSRIHSLYTTRSGQGVCTRDCSSKSMWLLLNVVVS